MPEDAKLEELDFALAYAAHVVARLGRPAPLAIERPLSLRPSVAEWFVARADAAAARRATLEQRGEPKEFPTPWQIPAAMQSCQKPFQLWNVNRDEWKHPIAFEAGLEYEVGHAATANGATREGHPGTVTPATAVAKQGDRERAEALEAAWTHRAKLFEMLAQDARRSGIGRRDENEKPAKASFDDDLPTSWSAPPGFGQ